MTDTLKHIADHPLEALSMKEVEQAVETVRTSPAFGHDLKYVYIALEEPPKNSLISWVPGVELERLVLVVVYEPSKRLASEVIVSITSNEIISVTPCPGMHPPIMSDEFDLDSNAVKADPRWQLAMEKRGITDLSSVEVHSWPAANPGLPADLLGRRIGRAVSVVREEILDNPFVRPVEGVVAIVDRDTHEVIEVIDEEIMPIPSGNGRYDTEASGPMRTDLLPIEVIQPQGPSFNIIGNEIKWQKWTLRVSLHPLEALVLHRVTYDDQERVRSILHRASLSEMVVPYGDPDTAHWWMAAFDAGEVMIGALSNSLALGCDCLGDITYLDSVHVKPNGDLNVIKNAICIHEEDYGILWKHTDARSGTTEVRRSRRLVVSSIATVGNYEYGFFWYFYLDGTIQMEVKLTGIMQFKSIEPGVSDPFSPTVSTGLGAPNHQHFFNFRLDMDVDGNVNSVYEVEAEPIPMGEENPYGNCFKIKKTHLTTEQDAIRDAFYERNRYWLVTNQSVKNSFGGPVGYKLVPHASSTLLVDPESSVAKRATFASHTLWVTPYEPGERHASGDYPNQHKGGDGLPLWTAGNRDISNGDIVLWHSFGTTHLPRPEDWPIMPVEYTGFTLKPVGFFNGNPALDVPPSPVCGVSRSPKTANTASEITDHTCH